MADLVGTRLGQYQILERISRGGSSTVYKAYQAKLDRFVAIKVLSPNFVDEEGFLERFQREAQAVARLDHPNILPVYDYDRSGDVVYIVMRYINTGTLRDLMSGPMDLRDTMEIVTQIGMALGYAHKQNVIHRDVKPSNILIGAGQWALLTDFGLAKIQSGDRKVTQSGVGVGTPDYMSPEQAQGLAVDGRADLYSLGAMIYEMLSHQTPFDGDSGMAILIKHITEPVKSLSEVNPDVPIAVEAVVLKALAKDPNQRYQTAEAMVAAFARAVGPIGGRASSLDNVEAPERSETQTAPVKSIQPPGRWLSNILVALKKPGMLLRQIIGSTGRIALKIRSGFAARTVSISRSIRSHWRAIGIALIALIVIALVLSGWPNFQLIASVMTSTPMSTQSIAAATNVPVVAATPSKTAPAATPIVTLTATSPLTTFAGMATIPGGSFTMGGDAEADESPAHLVRLDSYYIDLREVTNAQFARFAAAAGYQTDAERAKDGTTWRTFNTPDRQQFPVTYVSWNDAVRYCGYYGKRLPTEAEWERAARGATQRVYPWGNTFTDQAANTFEFGVGQPVAVASHSLPSPFGLYDMSGNVWEWVRDWYAADYYARSSSLDPIGPASGTQKVIRGGSFKTKGQDATTMSRGQASIDGRSDDIGFRCARTP